MPSPKLLMIHADDAGLSHSENIATILCLEEGIVNSYSIMVPCAGFEEMATFAMANPQYDYGIHLTLTCEWNANRFGPVLPPSEVPSLVDKDGCFYKTRREVKANASAQDVLRELSAQIDRAIEFGLSPSHLDSHMYSIGVSRELFAIYKQLGVRYNIPVFISRELIEFVGESSETYISKGDFVIDKYHIGTFDVFKNGRLKEHYKSVFDNLHDGTNILLLHPAYDDAEMKELTEDHPNFGSEWRQIDLEFFTSNDSKSLLEESDIELITWKDLHVKSMRKEE